MTLLPLALGVKRNVDAQGGGKRKSLSRGQIAKLVDAALEKDHHTCRYCGFTSKQFQKAIPKDWGVNDPRDGEMVTACLFCEQCLALESVGAMASGVLIWLPEMSQATINHLARAIYVAQALGDKASTTMKACAERAMEVFMNAKGEAKRRVGTDDPAVLAAALLENLDEKSYRLRNEKLEGLRLFPLNRRMVSGNAGENDQFPKIMAYWLSPEGPFGKVEPDKWDSLAKLIDKAA